MKHLDCLALVLCASLLTVPALAKDKVTKLTFDYAGQSRTYYAVVPDVSGPLPVVVLLHGSGRNGQIMADAWKDLASKEHFIVAAPDAYDSAGWGSEMDPPEFLHAVVDQVKAIHAVDHSRIYLFGHSAGAVYALFLAILDSHYFASIAVHAGAFQPGDYAQFAGAERRIPIAIWVGNQDSYFPLDRVVATKKEFEKNGFPIVLSMIPNHDHNYYVISDEVNRKAWEFLKKTQLTQAEVAEQP